MDWAKRFAEVSDRQATFGADPPEPSARPGASVARVKGIEKLSKTDLAALDRTAKDLGMKTDWLAAVISFETAGSFSPSVLNAAGSGAFGLIQFLPKTAVAIFKMADTPENRVKAVAKGRAMSFPQQLKEMVIPYFKGGTYKSLDDVYLKVFYPAAMGKASDYVVGQAGTKTYEQNKGFDKNADGEITRSEITSRINSQLTAALSLPRITITPAQWGSILATAVLLAAGTYYLSVNTNLLPFGPNANRKLAI